MSPKKILLQTVKVVFSAILAFVLLTVLCLLYYNVPVHYPNSSGATDYKWELNAFYSRATEGIAFGKVNNDGFINKINYDEGMKIDCLILGSSHMEAYNVSQSDNAASKLNALMRDKTAYNIGISGHTFLTCCSNLKAALENYNPSDYVIIETSRIDFSADELNSVLDGTLPEIADHSGGILGFLSRNPFLRLIYKQLQGFMEQADDDNENTVIDNRPQEDNRNALNSLLSYISDAAAKNNVKIIIFYHPTTQINSDGSLLLPNDSDVRTMFSNLCSENGITFLDMTERFKYEYEINHILPHGFCNSSVGSGHLNRYGHEMIADELYKIIQNQR